MNLVKTQHGTTASIALEGRLDAVSSPELEKAINETLDGIAELILDFEKVAYISSAGLRVLLSAQKAMNRRGRMVVKNANKMILDLFDMTGFSDILTIE